MVQLSRPNSSVSWGFRLQGGADFSTPLSIQLVSIGVVLLSGKGLRSSVFSFINPIIIQEMVESANLYHTFHHLSWSNQQSSKS